MTKLAEGSSNKVFLLKFDDGKECIARVPCPGLASEPLVISSEVATLDFVRRHLDIPAVPKVLAWSTDGADSEVGSSYIIMERSPGVPLTDVRYSAVGGRELFDHVINPVISMEKIVGGPRFSQIGSLYFKEDVSDELKSRRLYAPDVPDDEASDIYRIGPTVQHDFWKDERKDLDIDRGPWPDIHSYAVAVAERERRWITAFARDPPSGAFLKGPFRSPDQHHRLLDAFLATVQGLEIPSDFSPFVLWHPDAHRANVLVQEHGPPEVTGLVDWQHAWIGPRFLQLLVPPAFSHFHTMIDPVKFDSTPSLPHGFDAMKPEDQDYAREELRMVQRERLYQLALALHDRPRFDILNSPLWPSMALLFHSLSETWTDGPTHSLLAIAKLCRNWDRVGKPGSPCLVTVPDEAILELCDDEEHMHERRTLIEYFCNKARVDSDGGVAPEHYEEAKEYLEQVRKHKWNETAYGPWFAEDSAQPNIS
ncbi:hypothetical protein PUNSTDRAFT_129226 [Punctularia strigosozonata HHB-11173 SS5]|uniref:uncharacterized protein n=1 Tax=Punctularia strigosozonata (strain HHB-11173) TaxID=741275 RepID=UPI00044180A6|nr:uncharacterized protein PUNSTDRAFT_129226 [Punctularia strigosozonata HHB-11173 SS5]EIN13546.1 hypothetical protein PUNSTDRAFT_129226 [Punctularia strigosozonata HHB-11173 SS5]